MKGEQLAADGIRFILAGATNTILTLGFYQVALFILPHNISYALSWVLGVLFLIIVYPTKVFPGGSASSGRIVAAIAIYVSVFAVSLWTLELAISFGLHERLAIFVVLALSASLNFMLMRLIFRT